MENSFMEKLYKLFLFKNFKKKIENFFFLILIVLKLINFKRLFKFFNIKKIHTIININLCKFSI